MAAPRRVCRALGAFVASAFVRSRRRSASSLTGARSRAHDRERRRGARSRPRRLDDERALVGVMPAHIAAHPHALFFFGGGDLVADAFTVTSRSNLAKDNSTLAQGHRARRVELLRHQNERHTLCVEEFASRAKSASERSAGRPCRRPRCRSGLLGYRESGVARRVAQIPRRTAIVIAGSDQSSPPRAGWRMKPRRLRTARRAN